MNNFFFGFDDWSYFEKASLCWLGDLEKVIEQKNFNNTEILTGLFLGVIVFSTKLLT